MRILLGILINLICIHLASTVANTKIMQAQVPLNNQQWLENILDSILTKMIDHNVLKDGEVIQIEVISIDSSFNNYQRTFLRQKLLFGLNAILSTENSKEYIADKKLLLRWIKWDINYTLTKKHFWQKSQYLRNLTADFFVEIEDLNSKAIIFVERFRFDKNDTISKSKLKSIRNINLPFAMGNFTEKKGIMAGLVEPLFLFAISGTVVYLFYSIRSQ